MRDWEEDDRPVHSSRLMNMHPVIEPKKEGPMFSRGQLVSMMLAFVLLLYSIAAGDIPLMFLLLSFLIYLLRPPAEKFIGRWLANAMQGFSFALGMGALVMAFL
ncbi:MAG: hypothetical protein IJU05_06120 [Schwartzia sp.]|nr:hypothetical protein [Schwartzia sp. (in: firmicutes)]